MVTVELRGAKSVKKTKLWKWKVTLKNFNDDLQLVARCCRARWLTRALDTKLWRDKLLQTLPPPATFIASRGTVTAAIKLIASLIFFFSWWILHKSGRKKKLPPGSNPWPIIGNLYQLRLHTHRSLNYFADKYGPIFFLRIRWVFIWHAQNSFSKLIIWYLPADLQRRQANTSTISKILPSLLMEINGGK